MDDINMQKPEVPIIIIERDEQPQSKEIVTRLSLRPENGNGSRDF